MGVLGSTHWPHSWIFQPNDSAGELACLFPFGIPPGDNYFLGFVPVILKCISCEIFPYISSGILIFKEFKGTSTSGLFFSDILEHVQDFIHEILVGFLQIYFLGYVSEISPENRSQICIINCFCDTSRVFLHVLQYFLLRFLKECFHGSLLHFFLICLMQFLLGILINS